MSDEQSKKCGVCEIEFTGHGPWCHTCVTKILWLLRTRQAMVAKLVETVERIREQLRKAKAEGRSVDTTEVPGPYWGLDL